PPHGGSLRPTRARGVRGRRRRYVRHGAASPHPHLQRDPSTQHVHSTPCRRALRSLVSAPSEPAVGSQVHRPATRTRCCSPPPICSSSAHPTCWLPTPATSRLPRPAAWTRVPSIVSA